MKKFIGILAVCIAMCLCMTVVSFAATADIVHQSVEGTAVIDGTKDDAYANALTLPFIQKGESNGGGEVFDAAQGTAYIINDAEYVYVYFEVYDSALDNTSANNYEQDSVEAFWMVDNSKTQIRYHYDGVVDADSGAAPVDGTDYKAVTTDNGYAVELRLPITDVKNNQIEMCLQINACTDGKRDCTIYIEGNAAADNAYQRSNRQTDYDVWWTLALAGEHADSRVDPEEKPMELTAKNYESVKNASLNLSIHSNDNFEWSRWQSWTTSTVNVPLTQTVDVEWTEFSKYDFTVDTATTKEYTVAPQFSIDINDAGFLTIPEGAAEGDKGDKAKYAYTYSDITLTAEGFADVVIPGASVAQIWEIYVPSWGGTAGNGSTIDLAAGLKAAGLSVEDTCKFMNALTSVKFTITFDSLNLVDQAVLDEYAVTFAAEDEAKIAEIQEYIDRVEAAKTVLADETADAAAKHDAANDAKKAANRALKEVEGYPNATAKAQELVTAAEDLVAQAEKAVADAAAADAEANKPADDVNEPAPDEENNKPAASNSESGSNTGLIVGIIVAVVAVAIIAVVVVLGKKKKA